MNKRQFVILIIVILCVTTLIFFAIWFIYQNKFSAGTFNNISTPILSAIATIIYALALWTTIGQNKIILSQNIKPFFEKEINRLEKKAQSIDLGFDLFPNDEITIFNYTRFISKTLINLKRDEHYTEDIENFSSKNNAAFTLNYLKSRSYYPEFDFLQGFINPLNEVNFFYNDLRNLIEEINNSKLILEDKSILKKQIQRTFLLEYMSLIKLSGANSFLMTQVPIIDYNSLEGTIEFENISKTDFSRHYNFFLKEFSG